MDNSIEREQKKDLRGTLMLDWLYERDAEVRQIEDLKAFLILLLKAISGRK